MSTLKFDDKIYDISSISEKAKSLRQTLEDVELRLRELRNMHAVLTKAKNAYISDLKVEILHVKSGLTIDDN